MSKEIKLRQKLDCTNMGVYNWAITLLQMMRIHHWIKNLLLLFPPVLAGSALTGIEYDILTYAMLSFCFVSSFIYIVNDIYDKEYDIKHHVKRNRPIASGKISIKFSLFLCVLFCFIGFYLSLMVSIDYMHFLCMYVAISLLYTLYLKDIPVVDIFCVSSGFVIRLYAGGEAFHVDISVWLFLSVLFLSLFLSSGKRLGEQMSCGLDAGMQRRVLIKYPAGLLDSLMVISASSALTTYSMYVVAKERLVYSVPLCCFGLFRYLYLTRTGHKSDPINSLVTDPILFFIGLLWVLIVVFELYVK